MATRLDNGTIEIPLMLRERLTRGKLHPRQAYHELIEAALDFWDDHGGWDCTAPRDLGFVENAPWPRRKSQMPPPALGPRRRQ